MSQDVNNPGKSGRNNSTQLQIQNNNGQRVIVLTPGMLKDLGLTDEIDLFQSEPQADCNIGAISPIKIENNVQKFIAQKVLKTVDTQEPKKNCFSETDKKKSSTKLQKITLKNAENNSSILHWIKSKSKIVNEELQNNVKHDSVSKTLDSVHSIPTATQSSVKSASISQLNEKKYKYKKSIGIVSPKLINKSEIIQLPNSKTSAKSTPLPVTSSIKPTGIKLNTQSIKTLSLVTNSLNDNNKSTLTKKILITLPKKSTETTKLIKNLNKTPPKVTNSPANIYNCNNTQNTKSAKLNVTKNNSAALLLQINNTNSSEPSLSSSSSHSKKSHKINIHHISKNTTDKNLLSQNNDIVENKSSLSVHKLNVKALTEQTQPTIKTSQQISNHEFSGKVSSSVVCKLENTCIEDEKNVTSNDVEKSEKKIFNISPKKEFNISNNDRNESSKQTVIVKNYLEIMEEVTVKEEKSDDTVVIADNLRGPRIRIQQQAKLSSKKGFKQLDLIDNEKISEKTPQVCKSQSMSLAINSISSSMSADIEENSAPNSKANQSKIINENFKKSHDKLENKNEKINVPDATNISKIPNTSAVLEIPTVKKPRGRPRKSLVVNTISESNLAIEKSNDESLVIDKTNEIANEPVTLQYGRTRSSRLRRGSWKVNENAEINNDKINAVRERSRKSTVKNIEKTTSQSDDEEANADNSEEDNHEKKHTYKGKKRGRKGRRRGKLSTSIVDSEYIPRTSESNHKEKKNNSNNKKNDSDTEESINNDLVCGKCSEKMQKKQWIGHNLNKHNNMGWREGDKEPDFEGNEKLWKSVLLVAHKRKKGALTCEKCCTVKRSVVGFISHYLFCGKTDDEREAMKWTCPECHSIFMPSSQDSHERMHRDTQRNREKMLKQMSENGSNLDNGKRKRKAAEKAATKITEFTASITKDTDEPSAKKKKISSTNIKDLIEHPGKTNSIPSVWKSSWMKAAAENEKLQCRQPGCSYDTLILNEMYDHCNECKFAPISTFLCKICKHVSETLPNMEEHVKENHADQIKTQEDSDFSMDESSDDSDTNDNPLEMSKNRKSSSAQNTQSNKSARSEDRAAFIRNEKYYSEGNIKMTFIPALRWTLDFELKNYCMNLFDDYQPNNFILLTNSEANDYIPKLTESMRVKQVNVAKMNLKNDESHIKNDEWKIWNRFESSVVDGFPTFFVGGPVWATAWLPIPTILYSHNVNQYIAISTHSKMNDSFITGKSYKFKNIIQLWDLGHLEHSLSHIPTKPKLAYAIAHDKGTIWCMEWCPSGAYENSLTTNDNSQTKNSSRRMGLLAVASSDGCVHIYSMAFPEELNFIQTDKNNLPIYKTDPVVTLQVNNLLHELDEVNWQCMTLNWSKLYGHDTIAAGFTNGYVGLWDLTCKSPLLVTKNNATLIITCYRHFYAHGQAVTGITIIPLKGKRYLATTSIDRSSKFWDLEDVSNCVSVVKKGVSVNSTWISHWPNIYSSYDNVLGMGRTTTYMISLRESFNSNTNKTFPLLPSNSTTYGLASSDFANGICHGTSAGELVAIFPFQMLYLRELDKLTKKRWLVSSIEVVDFKQQNEENIKKEKNTEKEKINKNKKTSNSKEYTYMPETYEECNERFGIIFYDDVNNIRSNRRKKLGKRNPLNSETMKAVPVEQYNYTSINRISWNPNAWSYLYLGIGYQNGLFRILHLKSMSMQNAIMKLLPEHAGEILNKQKMSCNPLKWKLRSIVYFLLIIIGIYVLFIYKKVHNVNVEVIIKNTNPEDVWEFVADFSNMLKLNPTIKEFNIIEESGNFDNWKYSVHYKEHLSHLPAIQNTAHGHYSIKADGDDFLISSTHKTCFFTNFDCVNSVSEFRFSGIGADTKCIERVEYECPIGFSSLCYREVMYQRDEIMSRLKQHFDTSNNMT
ncbi:hypothetical protein PV325_007501 [Microctonus aethiopoides]|nr:hypothetical protein PV325_007501 [Microctonus aethiopoides]